MCDCDHKAAELADRFLNLYDNSWWPHNRSHKSAWVTHTTLTHHQASSPLV
jgi:hypothetical protein